MTNKHRNWIFLGDSLTEGIGSKRVSYVTGLSSIFQENTYKDFGENIHEIRLRKVDPRSFNKFLRVNIAGRWDPPGVSNEKPALWLWNLACEGTTIESDGQWMPLLSNLQPEIAFIFRGSLESIIRQAPLRHGIWPMWVPHSWRGYAGMDPRCYYSTTWWRRLKQSAFDAIRQRIRHALLKREPGHPLVDMDVFMNLYEKLIEGMLVISKRVILLGLLPISEEHFPGSGEQFRNINMRLRELAERCGVEFFDWGAVQLARPDLFYKDGFHPNQAGSMILAELIYDYIITGGSELIRKTENV